MKFEFVITAIACLGLILFAAIGLPKVSIDNINAYSAGAIFPNGIAAAYGPHSH